ncbi:BTB/POZ protein [Trichophaea hybrida]|nr:BTB/POZ protein [Trichophaea hybrida]
MTDDKSKLEFFSKIDELFDSDTYTDLTIVVGATKFHVHQNLLKIRTPFFANATKPGGFSEANDNTVTIEEHSAHSVWRLLKYCYTGDYPEASNELALGEEDDPSNMKHLRVYTLADMLDVPGLKAIAAKNIETGLSTNWSAAEFPKIVSEVYSTTNNQTRPCATF